MGYRKETFTIIPNVNKENNTNHGRLSAATFALLDDGSTSMGSADLES